VLTNIAFVVPGKPHAKERARSTLGGRHYTPAKTANYEALIAWSAASAMAGNESLVGPLHVELEAVYAPTPSWTKKRKADALAGTVFPVGRPDLDNLIKSLDGCNRIVWHDDSQIVSIVASKRYGPVTELRVRVGQIGNVEINPC
jgi:Holliday junction resolvase RusA-like endonuclease